MPSAARNFYLPGKTVCPDGKEGKDMRSEKSGLPVGFSKKIIFAVLFVTACAIAFSGAFYGAYSLLYGVSIPVMNIRIPGVVFGLCVLYLGVRYLMKVLNLKKELYQPTSRFRWENFRKKKHSG